MARQSTNGATPVATPVVGGAPVITGAPAAPAFSPSLQLGQFDGIRQSRFERRLQRHWFLNRTDADLAMVTSEDNNPALGITKLTVEAPTQKQKAAGIVCRVSMESLTGMDFGITVWESKKNPGDITVMTQGREITRVQNGQESKDWVRDRRLNDATTAQILSFVWGLLVPAQQ